MTPGRFFVLTVSLLAMGQWVSGKHFLPAKEMEVLWQWKLIDYLYPSEEARQKAIKNNEYYPYNVSAIDFNMYKNRQFVTTPRFKYGIPATISTISNKTRDGQYLLDPFPSFERNRLGNCEGLTSVYFTHIDEFGQLWILDTGTLDTLKKQPIRVCQPKFEVYDLNAGDKLVARYMIPDSVLYCHSQLLNFQLDRRSNQKDDLFIYITDVYANRLVVFDVRHNIFTRIAHPTFLPYPQYGDYYIAGVRTFLPNGIFTVALGPICNGDRRVYYHAVATLKECWVMASTIRSKVYLTNETAFLDSFYCYEKQRESQSAPEVITKDGISFFQQETLNAIACWNTETDYNMENTAIVARNDTTMQGIRTLKLIGPYLYTLSPRLQLYIPGELSRKEINFRVLRAKVDDLLYGTPCIKPCPQNVTVCKSYTKH